MWPVHLAKKLAMAQPTWPPLFCYIIQTDKTDYYGAIRNTQHQLFGRKHAKRVKEVEAEARDPNMVVRSITGNQNVHKKIRFPLNTTNYKRSSTLNPLLAC